MRREHYPLVSALAIVFAGTGLSAQAPEADRPGRIRELRRLDHEHGQAWLSGDTVVLRRFLAPGYTFTGADGQLLRGPQLLATTYPGSEGELTGRSSEVEVRLYADVAVIVGRWEARGTKDGRPRHVLQRYTNVWVRMNGRWVVATDHVTDIPPPTARDR